MKGQSVISESIALLRKRCEKLEKAGVSPAWVQRKEGAFYLMWQEGDRKKSKVLKGAEIRIARGKNSRYKAKLLLMSVIQELEKGRFGL